MRYYNYLDSPLSLAIPTKSQGKTIGVKLNEAAIMSLNLRLKSDGFKTFSEFVHAYINGKYPIYEKDEQVEKLLIRIREKGITDP